MIGVSWTEQKINDSLLSEKKLCYKIYKITRERRWNMTEHILKHEKYQFGIFYSKSKNGL